MPKTDKAVTVQQLQQEWAGLNARKLEMEEQVRNFQRQMNIVEGKIQMLTQLLDEEQQETKVKIEDVPPPPPLRKIKESDDKPSNVQDIPKKKKEDEKK